MIPLRDRNPSGRFPAVTLAIAVACALVFAFEWRMEIVRGEARIQGLFASLGIVPIRFRSVFDGGGASEISDAPATALTLFTSMFLHASFFHLLGNVWFLWVFGDNVEDRLGTIGFALFYVLCGCAAGLTHVGFHLGSEVPTVGASGAIAGVLGAYLLLFPRARVLTLIPLGIFLLTREMPAFLFLGIWFLLQFLLPRSGAGAETVAYEAHIGGFLAGLVLLPVFLFFRRAS